MGSRRCYFCNTNVHRASYAKLLRSKKHLEKKRLYILIIPERLFKEEQTPIKRRIKIIYNP